MAGWEWRVGEGYRCVWERGRRPRWPSDKDLPVMEEKQETGFQFLGGEDPLEEGIATHSSTLAWEIPWTEEPGGLQSMGSQRVRHDWAHTLRESQGVPWTLFPAASEPRLVDGHPGQNDWRASTQAASKNLINNDFLKLYKL